MRKNERRLYAFLVPKGIPLVREDGDDHAMNKMAILQREFTVVMILQIF